MFGRKAKAFLLSRESEKGQVLVIFIGLLVMGLAVLGVLIDVGIYTYLTVRAHNNAAAACVSAAEAYRRGGSAPTAFANVLQENGYDASTYSPNEGAGLGLTRGLDHLGQTWFAAVKYQQASTGFMAGIVGINDYTILGRARCVGRDSGGLAPIAVRESAVQDSIDGKPPEDYTILGRDPHWDLADVESGTNFRGAVFLHMWCIPSDDPNCPDVRVFYPLTEDPPSAQTQKKLAEDCFLGINCALWPDVGQRLPIVSGTSDAQLCHAFQEGGWKVGDKVVVIVFDGEVYNPDPTYGNWENVGVIGYAVYQITGFEPNDNNCNHVTAFLASDHIYTSLDEIPNDVILLRSREIPWDYSGAIPW